MAQMAFSELLKRSLVMAIPGMIGGMGAGIAASDPRRPYLGLGTGLQVGAQSSGAFPTLALGQIMKQEEQDRMRQQAIQDYETDTGLMAKRERVISRERRRSEAEAAAEDARLFRPMMKKREQEAESGGLTLGVGGLSERDKFALTADALGAIIAERQTAMRQAMEVFRNQR